MVFTDRLRGGLTGRSVLFIGHNEAVFERDTSTAGPTHHRVVGDQDDGHPQLVVQTL